jgi:hypothetical protein
MNFPVKLPASYLLSAKYWSHYGTAERQLDWILSTDLSAMDKQLYFELDFLVCTV